MSLDTSEPSVKYCADTVNARYAHGRPDSELVPSRYALRVGEIDVLVVSDGDPIADIRTAPDSCQ